MYRIDDDRLNVRRKRRPVSEWVTTLPMSVLIAAVSTIPVVMLGAIGIPIAVAIAIIFTLLWNECWSGLLIAVAVLCLAAFGFVWLTMNHQPMISRGRCVNNIRQIVLAVHNYESANLKFPAPYSQDEDGKPLHSWRVELLPYLDQSQLREDLDLNKRWDDPHNLELAHSMPSFFRCPNTAHADWYPETPYVGVIGPETVWRPDSETGFEDITDGASNTVMILESHRFAQHWLNPNSVTIPQIVSSVYFDGGPVMNSQHPGGANVGMADGSVRFLRENFSVDDLETLLTIDAEDQFENAEW